MSGRTDLSLTAGLAWGKIRSARFSLLLAAVFPGFVGFLGIHDGPRVAMAAFLCLFPHAFLFLAQDMVGGEMEGCMVENILFLAGRFRTYFWAKNFFLMAVGTAYSAAIFTGLTVWTAVSSGLHIPDAVGFLVGLAAGYYYVAAAGLLSYRMKSGSNVVLIILVQLMAFFAVLFSVVSRNGLVDYIESGRFPDLTARLMTQGLGVVVPNIFVLSRLRALWWQLPIGMAACLAAQRALASGLEMKK